MPRYRYLALAAAGAMALAPAGAAYAASAHQAASKPVLTISKVGGKAVKKGAKLTAGLAKGTKLTVSIGSAGKATCTRSSIGATVKANPNSRGKATLSLTRLSITSSSCKITAAGLTGAKVKSLTAIHLPAGVTVSPAKGGGSVVVSESGTSKPLGLKAVVSVPNVTTQTCVFTAKSITGKESNKTSSVKVAGAKLALDKSASTSLCNFLGTTAKFSVTYGPLRDSSVTGHPKVYVR